MKNIIIKPMFVQDVEKIGGTIKFIVKEKHKRRIFIGFIGFIGFSRICEISGRNKGVTWRL